MRKRSRGDGFTLIEILLVAVIIGVILAVVVPRAWRANVDANYNLVRQAASELASSAEKWGQTQLVAQGDTSSNILNDYFATLAGLFTGEVGTNNWNISGGQQTVGTHTPTAPVEELIAAAELPVNPFNGSSYFAQSNSGSFLTPGALYCASVQDGTYDYYAFVYLGTDSESLTDFHDGQTSNTLPGLRNGVFIARLIR